MMNSVGRAIGKRSQVTGTELEGSGGPDRLRAAHGKCLESAASHVARPILTPARDSEWGKAMWGFSREWWIGTMRQSRWNVSHAAMLAGVHRAQVYRILQRLDIDLLDGRWEDRNP